MLFESMLWYYLNHCGIKINLYIFYDRVQCKTINEISSKSRTTSSDYLCILSENKKLNREVRFKF
jgi:hypothetical protein